MAVAAAGTAAAGETESPYRKFVITTELRSDPKQSKYQLTVLPRNSGTSGGRRGFLKGGFALVGFGGPSSSHYGGLIGSGGGVLVANGNSDNPN